MSGRKFNIIARESWYVSCKDCLVGNTFDSVDTAHDWINSHHLDCVGVRV